MRGSWHKNILQALVLTVLAMFFVLRPVFATSAPAIINYQGRLLDINGVPVASSTASMKFRLCSDSACASPVWSNSDSTGATNATARTVTLTDGLFSEPLGDTSLGTPYAAIPSTVFSQNAAVYLEVIVGGETLTPRKQILSSPFALNANALTGLSPTTSGSTSSAVVALDANGALTITGNPGGSGIGQGSLYVNPASGDVTAGDTLFGVAISGAQKFRIDSTGLVSLTRTTSGQWLGFGDGTDVFGVYNSAGSPNGSIAADIGSLALDTTNGAVYVKTTDTANTGWSLVGTATNAFMQNGNAFGAAAVLGTTDANTLSLMANNVTALTVSTTGNTQIAAGKNFSAASGAGNFDWSSSTGTFSTSTGTNTFGGNLVLQGTTITGSGASLSLSSAAATALTIDSGTTGTLNIGTTNSAKTINIATGTGGDTINLGTGAAANTIAIGNATGATAVGITAGTGILSLNTTNQGGLRFYLTDSDTSQANNRLIGASFPSSTTFGSTQNFSGMDIDLYTNVTYANGGSMTGFSVEIGDGGASNSTNGISVCCSMDNGLIFTGATTDITTGNNEDLALRSQGTGRMTFFTSSTTSDAFAFTASSATSAGVGTFTRSAGGSDFTASSTRAVLTAEQLNTSATTTGTAMRVRQFSTGNASALIITQDVVATATSTPTAQALVIDVNESQNSDTVMMTRSSASGTADAEFRITNQGDVTADNSFTGGGADYAEFFKTSDTSLTFHDLACYDDASSESVQKCLVGDTNIVGVISSNPGFIGNNTVGAEGSLSDNPHYRLVGLVGQIETAASTDDGAIAIGDPLTASSTQAGFVGKATHSGFIVGRALEALSSGSGTIKVMVQPMWYAADVVHSDGSLTSSGLTFQSGTTDFSFSNSSATPVMTLAQTGDLAISGKLYLSDRGTMQHDAYMYYDGSGGGYVRTNAAGWGTGSYDFAEMFPSTDTLTAGEIVTFGTTPSNVVRSTAGSEARIAGIVSTRPGFLAGESNAGYPIALSGRVPTRVTGEHGVIHVGDPLTLSSQAGYATKQVSSGYIVGYALDDFSGDTGEITVFVRPSYYVVDGEEESAQVSQVTVSSALFDTDHPLNMNGGAILAAGSITGSAWGIDSLGNISTTGQFVEKILTSAGNTVDTYAVTTPQHRVQLSGAATLSAGSARVNFADIDQNFSSLIHASAQYTVLTTPEGSTGQLYVTDRTVDGFTIHDPNGGSGISVDWLVIAARVDDQSVASTVTATTASDSGASTATATSDTDPAVAADTSAAIVSDVDTGSVADSSESSTVQSENDSAVVASNDSATPVTEETVGASENTVTESSPASPVTSDNSEAAPTL